MAVALYHLARGLVGAGEHAAGHDKVRAAAEGLWVCICILHMCACACMCMTKPVPLPPNALATTNAGILYAHLGGVAGAGDASIGHDVPAHACLGVGLGAGLGLG